LFSVAILAGGQSRRMGRDKAWLDVGGRPLIERVAAQVKPLTDDLLLSVNTPGRYPSLGLRLVVDIYPRQAALVGIYSALKAARHQHLLAVSCDMPFLNIDLLRHLVNLASTADIVVPVRGPGQFEALHAVYSKTCLPVIHSNLTANRLRIIDVFDDVSVRYVEHEEIARFDRDFNSFFNINTPANWHQAQQMAKILG